MMSDSVRYLVSSHAPPTMLAYETTVAPELMAPVYYRADLTAGSDDEDSDD